MEYKYHLIALIIILFLICIIYPPSGSQDCGDSSIEQDLPRIDTEDSSSTSQTEEEHKEKFESSNIPSLANIKLMAESCATQLAKATYSNVIYPCTQISNAKDLSACITGYTQYYEMIIKDPVLEMYSNIKNLEGGYYDYNTSVNSKEEYAFVIVMTNSYSRALSLTIRAIAKNYGINGFNNQTFIQVMKAYLITLLSDGVVNLYTNNKIHSEPENTSNKSSTEEIIHYVENHNEAVQEVRQHVSVEGEKVHKTIMEEIRQEIIAKHEDDIISEYVKTESNPYPHHEMETEMEKPYKRPNDVLYLNCDDIKNNKISVYVDGMKLSCRTD